MAAALLVKSTTPHVFLAFVAAVQARYGLHSVAVHDGLVEEHASEQRLIEAGLEFVGHDHESVVFALEPFLDQLSVFELVDGVLVDFRIGFGMREIREGVEDFVFRAALF